MPIADASKVQDKDGVWGTVVSGSPHLCSNATQVVVQTESGQQFLVPTALLVPQPDESYALPLRLAELEHAGSEPRVHQDESRVVPVLVEELEVQKRVVETGKVRITKVVHERETLVDEPLLRDNVAISRLPMERVVEGPIPVREENGTTIISVVEEVLVVEKRWMLREESISASDAPRRTSHSISHYAAKKYRLSVYLTLRKIHKGDVVWQRHWSHSMTRSRTLSRWCKN